MQELVAEYRRYKKLQAEIASNKELVYEKDAEISDMAKEELKALEPELEQSTRQLQILLLPKDPNDHKNVVFEIRAGAGGEEAALFVAELFRLYQRYCERQGWKVRVLSAQPDGPGRDEGNHRRDPGQRRLQPPQIRRRRASRAACARD